MEGSSVTRFKEILKVFTNYGLGYLLGKKEEKENRASPDRVLRFSDVRCRNFVVRPFLVGLFHSRRNIV